MKLKKTVIELKVSSADLKVDEIKQKKEIVISKSNHWRISIKRIKKTQIE